MVFVVFGCGGPANPLPTDIADDDGIAADVGFDSIADASDGFDLAEVLDIEEDTLVDAVFDGQQDVAGDVDSSDADAVQIVCTELTVESDCAASCGQAGPCQACHCDTTVPGGMCELVAAEDGAECQDGESCTRDDYCENGTCLPGRLACECVRDSDCSDNEDGDLCNGTLFCNKEIFPYECAVDPLTLIRCPTDLNSECSENQCAPLTGECSMQPANEGENCTIMSICTLSATCQTGECLPFVLRNCNDNNLCTDDSCEELLGCVRTNNTIPCNDNNVCTVGDVCSEGACGHVSDLPCDNAVFCDGAEWCDPVTGCKSGTVPTCNDDNSCTLDRCLAFYDHCFNDWIPTAAEGPRGSPTCTDGKDNDCDGITDISDSECLLGIDLIEPDDGVLPGGDELVLNGNSMDVVVSVLIDGKEAEFTVVSSFEIRVVTPAGDAVGPVDVQIASPLVAFTVSNGFTYTAKDLTPDYSCRMTAPAVDVIRDVGASVPEMTGQSLVPQTVAGNLVEFSLGYGPRATDPAVAPGWMWTDAGAVGVVASGANWLTDWSTNPVAENGGYFDFGARLSTDGGYTWVYCDLDGSENGFLTSQAPDLTVFGSAENGDVVVNELMWMGSSVDSFDEWFELRNMTGAPIRLAGWKLTGVGYPAGQDFLFSGSGRVINNNVIHGDGYLLVAQYNAATSARIVEADILAQDPASSSKTMRMSNLGPRTYQLIDDRGIVIDTVSFSSAVGMEGSVPLSFPYRSMERKKVPGAGVSDSDWQTAWISDGWDGDPFQTMLMGTPGRANSDVALCTANSQCASFHPEIEITRCQARICAMPDGRCAIIDVAEGASCDDGSFCTVGEKCVSSVCGGGTARDCSDVGGVSYCTIDTCDETGDACVHTLDLTVTEGPLDSSKCRDWIDNDCDGFTDSSDVQCRLDVSSISPAVFPVSASDEGWTATVSGVGFEDGAFSVTGVIFSGPSGDIPVDSFLISDSNTIAVQVPSVADAGLYDVLVTDGVVTAVLVDGVKYFGTASDMLARIYSPTDAMAVNRNQSTPYIKGRVAGAAIGTGANMISPSSIKAEVGYGPETSDPSVSMGWTWLAATYDSSCTDCTDEYQFRRTISIGTVGIWALAYRFSLDNGITWAWGSLGPYSADPWDIYGALTVTVME